MSVQILLQGKLLGIEEFLLSAPLEDDEVCVAARSRWVTLLSEVLPRALLEELGLSKMLLGASGGGQFLLVLPGEVRAQAEEFLNTARNDIRALSEGRVRLVWAVTENLGDWSVVRKRLNEEMSRKRGAPLAGQDGEIFQPFVDVATDLRSVDGQTGGLSPQDGYFSRESALKLLDTDTAGWSPETPGRILAEPAKHSWTLNLNISPERDSGGTPHRSERRRQDLCGPGHAGGPRGRTGQSGEFCGAMSITS